MINSKALNYLVYIIVTSMLLGCANANTPSPTLTPISQTPTYSPVPPTPATEPTSTLSPTPIPICNPGFTVEGSANENIALGFIDILRVSTTLEETKITVNMTLREIPNEITINRKELPEGQPEIALGVAIDVDNNPDTGSKIFVTQEGYGYDNYLQIFKFKMQGDEQTGGFQDLLRYWHSMAIVTEGGGMKMSEKSSLLVDQEANTITLIGNIDNISSNSYLHFYSFYKDTEVVVDQLCQR